MNGQRLIQNFIRPKMGRRLIVLVVSLTVMGCCIAVFKTVGFGTDPCSTLTLGLAAQTGISFGTCQMIFNFLLFLPVLRYDLSRIGIGTVCNMVGVGYVADSCLALFTPYIPETGLSTASRLLLFAVSMVCFLLAASFYLVVDLGVSPYDAVPQLISARFPRASSRLIRIIWDVSVLSVGFLLGSTVGLTTLVTGFCLGPAIAAVSERTKAWFEA